MKDIIEITNFEKDFDIDDVVKYSISQHGTITAYTHLSFHETECYIFFPISEKGLYGVYYDLNDGEPIKNVFVGYLENKCVDQLKELLIKKFEEE